MAPKRVSPFYRLVSYADRDGPLHPVLKTRCWIWRGSLDTKGYARLGIGKRTIRANRCAWMAYRGAIPTGLYVLHKCDNPACINPNHLFLGTSLDNLKDRDNKNRQAKGVRQHLAKLNDELVREIRRRHKKGCPIDGATAIAEELRLSVPTIISVINRETWKHVV